MKREFGASAEAAVVGLSSSSLKPSAEDEEVA
jgi:hypothetical protein